MASNLQRELQRFPRTGRFLRGRLRSAMADQEMQVVEELIESEHKLAGGEPIARRGAECSSSTILVEGFAIRVIERRGHAHIVGLQVPGDFVDLPAFALKRLDHDILALGEAKIGRVSHARIRQVIDRQPHLARLLWFATLLDAAIHREWILKLEDLNAAQRVAHVFCEICRRLDMVGLGGPNGFSLPLTQAQLASMCGTTAVHMSRALRRLRDETGATFRHGKLQCPDPAALAQFCEFDPSYLYGPGELQLPGGDYED
uniref:Crp/Fnr family transcriptional regulator n=1 Tax=Altererythrobacter segetis TaxID=1104773 RepID=UPI001FAEF854|nr:Crp/Fnr family transcriptional regulator [Altererythrobacter segetis]